MEEFSQDPVLVQEFITESEELLQAMDQDMVELISESRASSPGFAEARLDGRDARRSISSFSTLLIVRRSIAPE
jgi:hypothetical protein